MYLNERNRNLDIKEISRRLQVLYKKREKHYEKDRAWFDSTPDLFLGIIVTKLEEVRPILYVMDHKEKSHHTRYPDLDGIWYVKALRDKELPLYINETKLTEAQHTIIKQRLKGELKEIPIMQKLVDTKQKLDERRNRISIVIGTYEGMLVDYLYNNRDWNRRDYTRIIVMDIEGTKYHFSAVNGGEINLIHESCIERWDIK